jgi:voltage-gated potassium channel Kch
LNRVILPVGVLIAYFVVPVGEPNAPLGVLAGSLCALAGLGLVAYVVVDEIRRADKRLRPAHLILLAELAIVIFALVYYAVAVRSPGQFGGLETRLDALYFSLTTVATVGYGDINAVGQLARALVSIQLVFNVGFIAAIVGMLKGKLQERRPA